MRSHIPALRTLFLYLCFPLFLYPSGLTADPVDPGTLTYHLDLRGITDDQFTVRLLVEGLGKENDILQFAATAPGTYQVMDIGRYVTELEAFDKKGRALKVEQVSVNQWKLKKAKKVREIRYRIRETWDTPVDAFEVYPMAGTSIEADHVLLNPHAVMAFPRGMQAAPVRVKLELPADWKTGTALAPDAAGYYTADNYDHLVDSPFLIGELSTDHTMVGRTKVDFFTYSENDQVSSEQLRTSMENMLQAAGAFLGELPVDRYTFLFHFESEFHEMSGAWEHSYSSEYVTQEAPFTEELGQQMTSVAAHEFFHVVTPLNLHSEIIEHFNFETPVPSAHLWLYEGTTEWAAQIMQLRAGQVSLEQYLGDLQNKMFTDQFFDPDLSLVELAKRSYSKEGSAQYANIYARGALAAGLLDIRLLELSGGTRGLREVILELIGEYGRSRPFPEERFFDLFVERTYPEIASFFDLYIKSANPLPIREYYAKLGIDFEEEIPTEHRIPSFGFDLQLVWDKLVVRNADPELTPLRDGDEILAMNDTPFTGIFGIQSFFQYLQPGTEIAYRIRRGGEELTLTGAIGTAPYKYQFVFSPDPDATPEQLKLREAWMGNGE